METFDVETFDVEHLRLSETFYIVIVEFIRHAIVTQVLENCTNKCVFWVYLPKILGAIDFCRPPPPPNNTPPAAMTHVTTTTP